MIAPALRLHSLELLPALLALAIVPACGGGGSGGVDALPGADGPPGDAAAAGRADVRLTTSDGLSLTGFLSTSAAGPAGAPGVVLVHQFQRDDAQWGDLPETLAARGLRVLAFDLRGHGESDAYAGASLTELLTDPEGAPRDVQAALAYLGTDGGADPTRLAIVGTSIGANLAVAAAIHGQARTYVALSARKPPVESLAGAAAIGMTSVLYLAAELDGGDQAADARAMHDATTEPRGLEVYPGIAHHGIDLLELGPDVNARVLAWLDETL